MQPIGFLYLYPPNNYGIGAKNQTKNPKSHLRLLDYPIGREIHCLPAYRIGSHIYRCHGKYRQRRRRRYKPLLHKTRLPSPRRQPPFRTRKDRNDFGLNGRNTHHYGRCDYYLPRLRTTVHPFPPQPPRYRYLYHGSSRYSQLLSGHAQYQNGT